MPPHWKDATDSLLKPLLSAERLGVVSDVDGTLSPIVSQPEDAIVTPTSKAHLQTLAAKLPLVAAISGRAAADIHTRVGVDAMVYVGNHGLERWVDGGVQVAPHAAPYIPNVQAALAELAPEEAKTPGFRIEDKGVTASLHYRNVENPAAFAEMFRPIVAEAAQKHDLKLFEGRMIFELRPPVDGNKGTALAQLAEEFSLDAVVWLGDDITDVDAMKQARALREAGTCYGVSVGVLSGEDTPPDVMTYSDVAADGVADVEFFLGWLSSALSASNT